MKKIQVQGVHHITLVGSTKQSAIDFWQGALGMPFIFEQPNLGKPDENHLYFDPGDGRLLTVFTDESRGDAVRPMRLEKSGASSTSPSTCPGPPSLQAPARPARSGASNSFNATAGPWTRSISAIPTVSKVELACHKVRSA